MDENTSLKYYLKKVLPNIDLTSSKIRKIVYSKIPYDSKIRNILSIYFNQKRLTLTELCTAERDAKYIKKLFPTLRFSYILEQLEIFKDMSNRTEIVLRIIIHSKMAKYSVTNSSSKVKKHSVVDSTNNHFCPIKIRKLTNGPTPTYTVVQENKKPFVWDEPIIATEIVSLLSPSNISGGTKHQTQKREENNFTADVPMANTTPLPVGVIRKANSALANEHHSSVNMQLQKQNGNMIRRKKVINLAVIGEHDLPVAKHCTISSTEEPKKENLFPLGLQPVNENAAAIQGRSEIDDYLSEFMTKMEQKGDGFFIPNEHIIDEAAIAVARNYTLSDLNEIFNTENDFGTASNVQIVDAKEVQVEPYSCNFVNKVPFTTVTSSTPKKEETSTSSELQPVVTNVTPVEDPSINSKPQNQQASLNNNSIFNNIRNSTSNNHHINDIAATSKAHQEDDMNADTEDFNLVQYLQDVTNAPLNFIYQQCRKLNVCIWMRPKTPLLQVLVDNLLNTKISSESSDDEDDVEEVEPVYSNQLCNPVIPKKMLKLGPNNLDDKQPVPKVVSVKPSTSSYVNNQLPHSQDTPVDFSASINNQLVTHLCGIFPDACPDYIKSLCGGKSMTNEVLNDLTTVILSTDGQYPKRPPVNVEADVFPENQLEILIEFLPDADPDYLRMMCDRFEGKPDLVKEFLNEAMERKNYPTKKEYQRRQQLSAQQKQYTTEFNIENFIKLIPDPHAFFSDSSRTIKMDNLSCHYALVFLRNTFNKLPVRIVQSTFTKNSCKLYKTFKELQTYLERSDMLMKSVRKPIEMPNGIQNIPLLQEIAYFAHEKEINEYLDEIKNKEEAERREAVSQGLMKTCGCCYDEEVLPRDIFSCENGCSFCKSCIVKSTEVLFGEGKLDFPCLMNCPSHFSLQTLQAVLSPKLFSKIAQKKALEEIKSAGINELEMCPFCDFATIPAEGYNIFSCLNPECMKESCRLCKEPSHAPLRCEEIEKDEDVKARTYVENKMTEALLKKCWKCGIKFFKEEGCNKMTCSCGAQMCYVCDQPVTNYKHFNGNGGDRYDLCPLYSDTIDLNKENVLKGAKEAKAEIDNKNLKYDPTQDIQQHYKDRAKKVPQTHVVVFPGQQGIFVARERL